MGMQDSVKKRVLVAEDEPAYARALVLKLQREGIDAQSVGDGEAALNLLTKEMFDLVLLDLIMPEVNGFGVLEELRAKNSTVPVIVLTNLSQEEDKKKCTALGARGFFEKSEVAIADVVRTVKDALK